MLYLMMVLALSASFIPVLNNGMNFTIKTDYFLMNVNSLFLMLLIYCTPLFIAVLYVKIGQDEKGMMNYLKIRIRPVNLHISNFIVSLFVGFIYMFIFLGLSYIYSLIISYASVNYIDVSQTLFNYRYPAFILENRTLGTYILLMIILLFVFIYVSFVYMLVLCV